MKHLGNSVGEERCICAGYSNGDLKMVDLRNGRIRWETNAGFGICSIQYSNKYETMSNLLATGVQSGIKVYDLKKGIEKKVMSSEKTTIWAGKYLGQDSRYWVTATGMGFVNLYSV